MQLRSRRRGLPEDGPEIVERHLAVWQLLDDEERRRLLVATDQLLSRKRWEAAQGFTLDDTVRVVIAAQAALLVLKLEPERYRLVSGILVHPSTLTCTGAHPDLVLGTVSDEPLTVLGWHRAVAVPSPSPGTRRWPEVTGPSVVTTSCCTSSRTSWTCSTGPSTAHRCCRATSATTGCGSAPRFTTTSSPAGPGPHAVVRRDEPGRVFRRATEVFFEQSGALRDPEPDLYGVLARFYRQDPALRSAHSAL